MARHSAPEQRGFVRALRYIHEDTGYKRKIIECGTIRAQRRISFRAARHVAVHGPRKVTARGLFEIFKRQYHAKIARQGFVDLGARAAVAWRCGRRRSIGCHGIHSAVWVTHARCSSGNCVRAADIMMTQTRMRKALDIIVAANDD